MARFTALKKHLRASTLPEEVQDAIVAKAKENFRENGGDEADAAKEAVQHFHDIVSEDLKNVRKAMPSAKDAARKRLQATN